MRNIILTIFIVFIGFIGTSQSNYTIKTVGNKYSENQIKSAFDNADFCGFYFKNKNHIIKLDDGSEILLIGEMQSSGFVMEQTCYVADDKIFPEASWSISPTGIIVRKLTINTKLN